MTNNDRLGTAVPWGLLVLLLVSNVPLFLCMPLTDDAAMFDLQARNLLAGGVLYRDIVDPNLPGVIWIQAVVRATLGTSSLALRAVDLLWFSVFVTLSRHWLASSGATRAAQAWLVFVLLVCYFSLSEWCHCQRDVWLLVPGLAGLILRRRQIERLRTVRWSFLEGLCWGAGVWLKPMIVLPAACCWVVSVLCIRSWRRSVADAAGLLAGGLTVGGVRAAGRREARLRAIDRDARRQRRGMTLDEPLRIDARLWLTCQRCLERFPERFELSNVLSVARDEAELERWESEDPLVDALVAEAPLDVASLVEDEIILSLPVSPRHEDGRCGAGFQA